MSLQVKAKQRRVSCALSMLKVHALGRDRMQAALSPCAMLRRPAGGYTVAGVRIWIELIRLHHKVYHALLVKQPLTALKTGCGPARALRSRLVPKDGISTIPAARPRVFCPPGVELVVQVPGSKSLQGKPVLSTGRNKTAVHLWLRMRDLD